MKIYKYTLIFLVLIMAFFFGFVVGFAYIAENPADAFNPETWRTFVDRLRSF